MLHTFVNTFFLFFYSGKSKFTERQKVHMKTYLYQNNTDKSLDITNPLREKLVEYQQT